jgi:hypothetical protein
MRSFALKIYLLFGVVAGLVFLTSCNGEQTQFSSTETRKQLNQFAIVIENGVSKNGPIAWLNYFEDSPDFFMASNGDLVFKDYQDAHSFIINVLVKNISKINLKWRNIKVDLYAMDWGSIGADFHEDLFDPSGKTIAVNGYFTATAHKTINGWRLRNVHWSIKPAG